MSALSPALKSGVTPMTGFMSPDRFWLGAGHGGGFARGAFVGGHTQEANRTITGEVLGRDDISPIHAGHPDVFRRLLAASGEGIGKASDNPAADGKGRLQRKI